MITPRTALPTLLAALLLVLAGCGGGGGGPQQGGHDVPPQTHLFGGYAYVVMVRDTATAQVRSETGLAVADGRGTFTITSTYIASEGGSIGPMTPAAATYLEGGDRSLSLTGLASVPLEGRVADDGSLALLSSRGPANPATAILMRRAISPPVSDTAGLWTLLEWCRMPLPGRAQSSFTNVTISGTGALNRDLTTHTYNLDGQINPFPAGFIFQQLVVEVDGWLTLRTLNGPPEARGALSADRNLVLLGGDFTNPKLASIQVLVRRGQAATTSALKGEYFECNFESSILGYLSGSGGVTLDGSGGGNWADSSHVEGIPFGPHPINVGYGVGPDGSCTLADTGSGIAWAGSVGVGGRYAFLTGGYAVNSNPLFMALLR